MQRLASDALGSRAFIYKDQHVSQTESQSVQRVGA